MKSNFLKTGRGFTLIEVMVVVAIISLLSSIIITITSVAKAKGNDMATISQVHEIQNAFQTAAVSQSLPIPAGGSSSYSCIGTGQTGQNGVCTFWGLPLDGDNNVKDTLVNGGFSNVPKSVPITVDGLAYNGYVYKLNSFTNGPAIYWAQSNNTPCIIGTQVLSGAGGIVCEQDAGSNSTANVEMAPSNTQQAQAFDFSLSPPTPNNLDASVGVKTTTTTLSKITGAASVSLTVKNIYWGDCGQSAAAVLANYAPPCCPGQSAAVILAEGQIGYPPCQPAGVSVTFSPAQCDLSDTTPSCDVTITPTGSWSNPYFSSYYTVVVQASGGGVTKTKSFSVKYGAY